MVPVYNSDIVEMFSRVADLLEIEGANPFRVRAYRNAARSVGRLSRSADDILEDGEDLTEIPGIGEDLAGEIEEIIQTGSLKQLEELTGRTPVDLSQMLEISGLGPKRVAKIHEELDVSNLDEPQTAAARGEIQELQEIMSR